MTERFILDENVVILAQKGENERGERDSTCLNLLASIIRICHTLVVDGGLWAKYQSQLSSLGREPQTGTLVLAVLRNAFRREGKVDYRPETNSFPEEADIPAGSRDDLAIVRLAVETKAALVTTDAPLREVLRSSGVTGTYSLRVLSPAEALEQL
ncbi:MAG: hypothetical protein O3A47_01780 [Chloroflexi bacterium]|nr:hypothetical protein [Chloroflexota bacterium]